MTTNTTATIYEFPRRGRFAANGDQLEVEARSQLFAKAAIGSGWYHEEAIQEAERAKKN